jgi:hypothetical protein
VLLRAIPARRRLQVLPLAGDDESQRIVRVLAQLVAQESRHSPFEPLPQGGVGLPHIVLPPGGHLELEDEARRHARSIEGAVVDREDRCG